MAEAHSSIRATEQYIASGSDLDERYGPHGCTPIMQAAIDGRPCSLDLLLKAGAQVDKRDAEGRLPLARAALEQNGLCVDLIIARSPNIHISEAMVVICKYCRADALIRLLHTASAPWRSGVLDMRSPRGDTPLTAAAEWHDTRCMELLLRQGADVNATNADGLTPLAIAAMNGHMAACDVLLAHPSIDVNPVAWWNIAPSAWRDNILEARRTQVYRSPRGKMAALRIARFLRDATCNPVYAVARRSLMRQYELELE